MFEIVTWKEQQSLVKLVRACKQRYDRRHNKSRNTTVPSKLMKEEILKEKSSVNSSSSSDE